MAFHFSPGNERMVPEVDTGGLARALRAVVRGEIRFDDGARALYATDASNYRQTPLGVVLPLDAEDMVQTVATCRRFAAPLVPRGGGTSLAGQTCNRAVVMDASKYVHRILALDPETRRARVQPGVVLDWLRERAERHHLTFGPDPATHNHCTLGGMIGNNSCGVHSVMAGCTAANVEELEILTYDGVRLRVGATSEAELQERMRAGGRVGEIYRGLKALRDRFGDQIRARFPQIPRRVSGYNLPALLPENGFNLAQALVGSEGTCVTVLEATLRLVPSPPARTLVVLGYPDIYEAGDQVPEILAYDPIGLEGLDDRLIADMQRKGLHPNDANLLPPGGGWMLVEFGGATKDESEAHARALMEALKKAPRAPSMKLFDNPDEEHQIWVVRESGLGATTFVPGAPLTWEGWEDSSVPPAKIGPYLRDLRALLDRYGYDCDFYGHLGQGCIHTRIDFDLETAPGIARFRAFMNDAADLVVGYGGSLSGEHGDGQARAELLPKMFGEELVEAFRTFKAIWDPDWKMNPGKVVDPYRIDENLRLGAHYHPPAVETHFQFPADHNSFAHAALRCVGVGECRRQHGGVMCPSYRATMEEKYSTRGRARLLFEMLRGDPLRDGWKDESVHDALHLCLSCKGCKSDCPVNVDMATYKAEFLAHYYEHRLRPRSAYAFGQIQQWSRLAAFAPGLVNFVTSARGLGSLVKLLTGMAPERPVPQFATQTFKHWFHQRGPHNIGAPAVVLWPDTFNNHFYPETARAAVNVLETLGFHVKVPRPFVCCGRPLYDFGMLDQAKQLLRRNLTLLAPEIAAGTPIVGLEPSCTSVFRDELGNLFPNDEDAKRLGQRFYTFAEFVRQFASDRALPSFARSVVAQPHCHHHAVMKYDADRKLMGRMGLDFSVLDQGCCGLAGAFGFERDHYDVSMRIGEQGVLPACRAAAPDQLIIADGFSCRTQIMHGTGRATHHVAEVMEMALSQMASVPAGETLERRRSSDAVSASFGG